MPDWEPSLGALFDGHATTFRVWAPDRARLDLVIQPSSDRAAAPRRRPLAREAGGYWVGRFSDVTPGARYRYRLDGREDLTFPDPASRRQPDGVHGASEVVDASAFAWQHDAWRPPPLRDVVFYELHVGTFTPEGTFGAATDRLAHLVELGVTAIELMPVGDFAGSRNWGYDGVALFAPARCYGTPDDLRRLVDAAHERGLALFLDVVYNHLGPDGAYAHAFSPYYFVETHDTAWGAGVNLDGPHSPEVRRFFIENAVHWVREYHVDGLRLDATHAMRDRSRAPFLRELAETVRARAPRPVLVVAEDHRNLAHMLRPADRGGWELDAVWADDFHHEVRVHTTGDRDGYYADYTGTTEDLATTIRQGWFFTGQYSTYLQEARGTSPAGLPPAQFVVCIQNHDQIGNRADGARLHHQIDRAAYRAATALLLLAPQTPLLFMGQEWAADSPFLFFTDHHPELGRLVTEGRRREFGAFAAFADPASRERIPDPQEPETFDRSRLDWTERSAPGHAAVLRLYRRLLAFRRECPAIRRASCDSYRVDALDGHTVAVTLAYPPLRPADPPAQWLHVVARLSGSGRVHLTAGGPARETLFTTEDEGFANPGPASPPTLAGASTAEIHFQRPGAVVLLSRA